MGVIGKHEEGLKHYNLHAHTRFPNNYEHLKKIDERIFDHSKQFGKENHIQTRTLMWHQSCPKMVMEKLARKWAQIFHLVMLLVVMALQSSKMPKCRNFKSENLGISHFYNGPRESRIIHNPFYKGLVCGEFMWGYQVV